MEKEKISKDISVISAIENTQIVKVALEIQIYLHPLWWRN